MHGLDDRMYDMPVTHICAVVNGARHMCDWLEKHKQNPRSFRQDRWEFHEDFYCIFEENNVSRKRRTTGDNANGTQGVKGARPDLRFVNVTIPESDYGQVEGLLADHTALCERFVSYCASGAEILVKRKRGTDDWLAMLTFDDPYRSGALCAITAWGSNPSDAIAACVWKWEGILVGEIPEPSFSDNNGGRRFG